ncbi:MAG: glycosyltransferase family 9 protein [Desulfovibrionaceae bacterium]|nr:glycosyltransferase family 9 protein [Desulfovibrionaceae bacterium]
MQNIAIWNTAFLGDAILTLPLLQTLRLAYPKARLDFYTRSGVAALFQDHPVLDRVFAYNKDQECGLGKILAYGRVLRERKYDLWISAHRSPRSACLAWLSRAGERLGYDAPFMNRLALTRTTDRKFPELHEVDRLLGLARALGLHEVSTWPEIALPAEIRRQTHDFFSLLGERPILGLHPGSVWGSKRWPVRYFADLAKLALEHGARIIIFAGPGEENTGSALSAAIQAGSPARSLLRINKNRENGPGWVSAAKEALPADILDLSATLDLRFLAAFIAELDCYVSNDSGPMHLAWAQKTPLVTLFGPTVPAFGFAPRGETAVTLEVENLPCRPCNLHGPRECPQKHHRCMRDLLPELVWTETKKRLSRRKTHTPDA